MEYILNIATLIGIYAILAISLNLIVGYTGIFSIHHAALFSFGAYTYAILSTKYGMTSIIISLLVSFLIAGVLSALIGFPTLRAKGDFFIVASYGLQVITNDLIFNMGPITGGGSGIFGIPDQTFLNLEISNSMSYLIAAWVIVLLTVTIISKLGVSPFGRLLRSISNDESVVSSAGKNPLKAKIWVFIIGGGFASLGGVVYAGYIKLVRPEMFNIDVSVLILTMVIIGGTGKLSGSILGAAIMVILPELIGFLDVPEQILGPLRQLIYGVLIVGFLMLRPTGIVKTKEYKDSKKSVAFALESKAS